MVFFWFQCPFFFESHMVFFFWLGLMWDLNGNRVGGLWVVVWHKTDTWSKCEKFLQLSSYKALNKKETKFMSINYMTLSIIMNYKLRHKNNFYWTDDLIQNYNPTWKLQDVNAPWYFTALNIWAKTNTRKAETCSDTVKKTSTYIQLDLSRKIVLWSFTRRQST